jgi:hypothetical protein
MFLVADATMLEMFKAFLSHTHKHVKLGCGTFDFEPTQDLKSATSGGAGLVGNREGTRYDSAVYLKAHEFLKPYQRTHRHAVVAFDKWYGTGRTAEESRKHVVTQMRASGWKEGEFEVVVIDPFLEAWLWTGTPHVKNAFRCDVEPRAWLQQQGLWPADKAKPTNPKAAAKALCAQGTRRAFDKTLHREIISKSSVAACEDPAFALLRDALQRWFPREDAQ